MERGAGGEADLTMPPHSPNTLHGQITRGKTARNRLRRVDNFLLMTESTLLRQTDQSALVIDLGYGAEPITTLESAARLRRANPRLRVVGVEIEPERVARAAPYADDLTDFRLGGFNLPLRAGETVRLIRAFNVLRQYDDSDVIAAWQTMGRYLLPGGLLIEGTSDPFGQIWVANLLRCTPESLVIEGVVFSTNFRQGFDPTMFQPVLPKNHIHRVVPGEPIHAFMEAWKLSARDTIAHRDWGLRQWFVASAHALADRGYNINMRPKLLRCGYVVWRDCT